jgi:SSS family solute:Na+ symporter
MSAYEYFGKRFGYPARVYSSLAYALGHFSKMGFVFYLLALTVSGMTGWKTDNVIVLVGAITVSYTLVGGIEAVIWADVMQGFVLWLGIAICLGFLFFLPAAGPAAIWHTAWASHKISLGSMTPDFRRPTIPVLMIYGFFYYFQRYTADQTIVQRYLVAKSDRAALRGIMVGSLLCIPVWTLFMLIGTLAWAYYKVTGEVLPAQIAKADQVFPHFIVTHIPAGLAGLFVAALFGAAMANLSSDFNSLAAIAVEDYYRILRPAAPERRRLLVAKLVVAFCGILCVVVATALAHTNGTALSLWYTVSAVVAGGLVGLFLLAFLCPRAGSAAAWCGIVACIGFTGWATGPWGFPLHSYMIGVIGHVVLFGTGYAASFAFPNRGKTGMELTLWGWLKAHHTAEI